MIASEWADLLATALGACRHDALIDARVNREAWLSLQRARQRANE